MSPGDRLERIDELNLGRLGLICIQERIPDDYTSWEVDLDLDGQPARLSCVAPSEFGGVPHGLDGDILNAILALFAECGAPEDGDVIATAHQILQYARLDTGGRYYQNLHASLHRLNSAKFVTQNAWRNHGQRRWTTQTFSLLERLAYDSAQRGIGKGTVIRIGLPKALVQSVRAQYIKPLDPVLLEQLERPLTRSVYRLLDAKRYDPTDPKVITMELRMSLVAWGEECKLKDLIPSRIKRTLQKAHDDLRERGYLSAVEYEGTGSQQSIVYRFGDGLPYGLDLVSRIVRHGVGRHVALSIVNEISRDDLIHRLSKAEFLLARDADRIQNHAGFVVSVLKDDGERYPDPPGFMAPSRQVPTPKVTTPTSEVVEEDPEAVRRAHESRIRALTLEEQADYVVERLTLLCRTHLSKIGPARVGAIRSAVAAGVLDAVTIEREALKALYENRVEAFLKALVKEAADPARAARQALLDS
ncbi:replication initiator protein A [Deinococcus pimensis]|uniref:replication initiator protein A n=1 Tax=Deinococcus pimensis TaxID=309888 RepID=UPI0004ADD145|nr:replication initiator protein A [Deinococcus pimensis]